MGGGGGYITSTVRSEEDANGPSFSYDLIAPANSSHKRDVTEGSEKHRTRDFPDFFSGVTIIPVALIKICTF